MKRRIIFRNLPTNQYDSLDDMFEEIPIGNIGNIKTKDCEYKEKEKGCFAGFLGFFRFFVNR